MILINKNCQRSQHLNSFECNQASVKSSEKNFYAKTNTLIESVSAGCVQITVQLRRTQTFLLPGEWTSVNPKLSALLARSQTGFSRVGANVQESDMSSKCTNRTLQTRVRQVWEHATLVNSFDAVIRAGLIWQAGRRLETVAHWLRYTAVMYWQLIG